MVGRAVAALLLQRSTQHLTNERLTKYEQILLLEPSVNLQKCSSLNPATLLPMGESEKESAEESHDRVSDIAAVSSVRPDLQDFPLEEVDCNLFTDGSAKRDEAGHLRVGYAVVAEGTHVLEAAASRISAQAAELFALGRACELT